MTQATEMAPSTFPPTDPSATTKVIQLQNNELKTIIGQLTRQSKMMGDLLSIGSELYTSPEVEKRSWDKTKTVLKSVAKWGGISAAAAAFMLCTAAAAGVGAGTMGFCGSAVGGTVGGGLGAVSVSVVDELSKSVLKHGEEAGKAVFSTAFCEKVNLITRLREGGYFSELMDKALTSASNVF